MTDFLEKIDIYAQQRQLLELMLEDEGIELCQTPKISPRTNSDNLPLSFAQARLWFVDQLQPESSAYNIPIVVRLEGKLNVTALEQSLNEILRRHEALRTTFPSVNEQPVQVIAPHQALTLTIVNLSHLPQTQREAQVLKLAKAEAERPFDLAQGRLLHVKLLHLAPEEYVLVLVMHHIISDGWSLGVFVRELALLYEAFTQGKPSPLPELPIQYADFALWQRQMLQEEALEKHLSYWKQQLGDNPPALQLPTDQPRPAVQQFCGARQALALSPELTAALTALSQQEGVTLFMTLLAAFKTLLYRYTHQEDISVGSPVANRNQVEIENLIGVFVNLLVMRTKLVGNPSFRELLARVREIALGAYAHQELPFEKLVEELQPERNLSHTPLFQVAFALQNSPMSALELAGVKLSLIEIDNQTAKFDLSLDLSETANGIAGWLEYNTDLFDASTIERMVGNFQTLLAGIVAHPELPLSELPLLTLIEQKLLREWNHTQAEYPQNVCIHHLFEAQAEKTPDAIAVAFGSEELTYRQLNHRANQLAHHLQSLGVKREVRVGICVERTLDLVVGLLGILKASGAYIPLDPNYPQERISFMLEDSQAPVLITQQSLITKLGQHEAKVVCLDTDWNHISQELSDNPKTQVQPTDNAYIIYTSGSTGQPKGVVIEHRNTVAFIDWASKVFARDHLTGVLASTSICFDLSVFEIFFTLSCGSKVILADNALALPTLPNAQEVTLINTVPSAIGELLRINGLPTSIKIINLAGEALGKKLVEQLYQETHVQQVFNLYGPSEDTTYSTWTLVKPEDAMVSIGRPIANTQAYILDSHLQPLPIGVPGELYLAGDGLARGYLNRPELTAERFIANHLDQQPNSRLYKTGDLVRYLADGNIEYLGRLDHQVKIRGFRIELGEIEAVLSQHPEVSAVVVTDQNQANRQQLIAYVVPQPGTTPSISTLRSHLKQHLPEYMLPSAFVMLDAFPLTPNGKIDRRALPQPDSSRSETIGNFVAPRNPIEEAIATIWAEVLQVEKVGVHDNFFELGGHSLLVTQLVSRLRATLAIDLPIKILFEVNTVAELATVIAQKQSEMADSEMLSQMLAELEQLSPEEVQLILASEN